MTTERHVKVVWAENDGNGNEETHVARGVLLSEEGEHFKIGVEDGKVLYIAKKITLKVVEEGVRQ